MPPLPALKCSPGREHVIENSHKRGQFDGGFTPKTKEDELVLFNEVKSQERDNFLLYISDDFEDSLSKLRHPARGETSDLLNVEGDKNDYDWLLTPPDTPLFPKLDDDDSQPVNLAPRCRTRSQPIPISRSVSDKSYQTSRTSYSPQRLSLSPRSSASIAQVRGRSSSATQSSPTSVIRSTTPIRSPYSPPSKLHTPTPRSSSPLLPRTSTSSSIQASHYGERRASPVNVAYGNSSSPKLQGWQNNLSGFNSEVPPNPQISLSDPSTSRMRVLSPASRNGRELSMKLGRKSMSLTTSRSISASRSPENYKGSMASSGKDDEESLQPVAVRVSISPPPRKDGALANNKAMSCSRKPYRTSFSNSVPRRSFDSSLRLMDQRRKPQYMFRPLLSSVPATTFQPIYSSNSSLTTTTSSNTSSEQGVIFVAPDLEDNEIDQTDLPGRWKGTEDFDMHEEAFLFDKVCEIIRNTSNEAVSGKHQALDEDFTEVSREKFDLKDIQNAIVNTGDATSITNFELAHCADNQSVVDGYAIMAVCSKCGTEFCVNETIGNQNLCDQCDEKYRFCTAEISLISVPYTENVPSQAHTAVDAVSQERQLNGGIPEFHEDGNGKVILGQRERKIELGAELFPNNSCMQSSDQNESQPSDQRPGTKKNIKIDVPECTGISVLLLQGSAGTKWPILQGKSLSATNILCSEPSYSRSTLNALRRSIVADSVSSPSSIDLGLLRQTEAYVQHQLSGKNEALGIKKDIDSNAQSMSSDNDASTNSCEPRNLRNEFDEIFSSSTECLDRKSSRDMAMVSVDHTDSLDQSHLNSTPSSRPVIYEECTSVHEDNCREVSTSESQHLNCQQNNCLASSSTAEIICAYECSSSTHTDENYQNRGSKTRNMERTSDNSVCYEMVEDHIMVNHTCENVILDAAISSSSFVTAESQDVYSALEDRKNDCVPSPDSPPEHSNDHYISQTSEIDTSLCFSEPITEVLEYGDSAIMVEGPRRNLSRNLTLEEATNSILFCSSIIHDLAYKAAAIAMETEQEVLGEHQAPLPITIPEKSIPGLREEYRKISNKHVPRSHKPKRKRIETKPNSPPREAVNANDVNVEEFGVPKDEIPRNLDGEKPPKLESKCNCSVM